MGGARRFLPAGLILLGVGLLIGYVVWLRPDPRPGAITQATQSPTVTVTATTTATHTPRPTVTYPPVVPSPTPTPIPPTATAIATVAASPTATSAPISYRERFGVTGGTGSMRNAYAAGLRFGSFANWNVAADPTVPDGVSFWQMIRLREYGVLTPEEDIVAILAANPGATWIIGNEPDVIWQDNVTPGRYAELYHDLYLLIKQEDPTALVAIAGVAQPTPLRRAYLDAVLDAYQASYHHPMPVDVWNVHAFILREEYGSWGVEIPPGLDDTLATPYEIADHDDMAIFRQNIVDFRAWMAARGYGDRPLAVTEYGQLMPYDYGFSPESITSFMTATFDFFLNEKGEDGYAPDDGRLVQWWFWFSLYEPEQYTGSNLYDAPSGQLTPLGEAFTDYMLTHQPQ